MSKAVYFAQPTNGGPIKVGTTMDTKSRMAALGAWIPGGIEIIAQIPGYRVREGILKALMKPWRVRNEWVRSCPEIWKIIIEAAEYGDLAWLPAEPDEMPTGEAFVGALKDGFRSVAAACSTLGIHPSNVSASYITSPDHLGKLLAYQLTHSGGLPPYLNAPTALTHLQGAA